ncbi:MAG: transglutaminaseTgpA domain-containing protein [Acidimicrobiales bacterium]
MSRRWTEEAGMLGASVVAAVSVARLATGATAPTVVTAVIGTVVVALLHRRAVLAVAIGVVAVAISSLWWGLHAAAGSGLLTASAFRALHHSMQAARNVLVAFHLPLVHTAGIVALCALLGGLLAVAGRMMGTRHPVLSLVPAIVVLVWSAVLLPATGAAVAGLALGACGFLVLLGDGRPARLTSVTVAAVSLGLAALTLAWPAVAGSQVVASAGPPVPAVAPSALSLATDLTGLESRDANTVLFRATTPVSTYWQVTSLTALVDDQWVLDPATAALLHGSTAAQGPIAPTGQRVFASTVTLSAYRGRFLPAPPSPVTATGALAPVVTTSGIVATTGGGSGSTYRVSAVVPAPVADTELPPSSPDTAVGSLPVAVRSLALSITGGQATLLDKAEALTDFFRSGQFHYQVTASQPAGENPLVTFLTQTRTGSCEEFAGAFALLARASGLPTRVAIGFTPGRPSNGVTVVRGGDAHAWPQVLIDGTWVSFEPTPELPSGELSPPGILGPSGLGQPNPTGPGTQPSVSVPPVTAPTPVPTTPPVAVPVPAAVPTGGSGVLLGIALAVVGTIVATGAVLWRRRPRTPSDRVIDAWRRIDRALRRRGAGRPEWRTPAGHIRALSRHQGNDQAVAALADMSAVSSILQDATFGSVELGPEEADRAERASRRARRVILAGALAVPPPGDVEILSDTGLPPASTEARR